MPRLCTIANALEVVGDRWNLLIVRELFYEQLRFTEIVENTGAPRDILSVRLRKLEEHGILIREKYLDHPPRYKYCLTEVGKALSPVLLALKRWGHEYIKGGVDPVMFKHTCGDIFVAQVHCCSCGEPYSTGSLTLVTKEEVDN